MFNGLQKRVKWRGGKEEEDEWEGREGVWLQRKTNRICRPREHRTDSLSEQSQHLVKVPTCILIGRECVHVHACVCLT